MGERLSVIRHVRDAMASAQDTQKEQSDKAGRKNTHVFKVGDLVLLNARNLPLEAVSAVEKTKLHPRYVGPFKVVACKGKAYRLQLPTTMKTHPVFYEGLLKPYHNPEALSLSAGGEPPRGGTPSHSTSESSASARQVSRAQGALQVHSSPNDQGTRGTVERDHTISQSTAAQHPSDAGDVGEARPHVVERLPQTTESIGTRNLLRPPPALLDHQGHNHYLVEGLLQSRLRRGARQFLVKWRGYPDSQKTWESRRVLVEDCLDLVRAFEGSVTEPHSASSG
jgi:hypothetical protein